MRNKVRIKRFLLLIVILISFLIFPKIIFIFRWEIEEWITTHRSISSMLSIYKSNDIHRLHMNELNKLLSRLSEENMVTHIEIQFFGDNRIYLKPDMFSNNHEICEKCKEVYKENITSKSNKIYKIQYEYGNVFYYFEENEFVLVFFLNSQCKKPELFNDDDFKNIYIDNDMYLFVKKR